jgi:hypothetical protein
MNKTCPVCSTIFEVAPHHFSRSLPPNKQVFCSALCAQKGRYRHGTICNVLCDTDAAYLAGFVDGEGSIMVIPNRNRFALRVAIAQSEKGKWILDWVRGITNIGGVVRKPGNKPVHLDSYTWVCNSDAACSLLLQLLPHLLLKHEQAELGIEFHTKLRYPKFKSDLSWQADCCAIMKHLNKRGG